MTPDELIALKLEAHELWERLYVTHRKLLLTNRATFTEPAARALMALNDLDDALQNELSRRDRQPD